jgi:uncharacterized caspase-like protein
VRLLSPGNGSDADGDTVAVSVEVAGRGGGIGRVEWRVNGLTTGIDTPTAVPGGQPLQLTRRLPIDGVNNLIEVRAYNAANLIVSQPTRVNIKGTVSAVNPERPARASRLVVLAAGVDDYADRRFKLASAVVDARALVQAFSSTGRKLYKDVETRLLSDAEVTRENLAAVFAEIGKDMHQSDVFVLYLAGHGKTVNGRYYYAPQPFRVAGAVNDASMDQAITSQGLDQEQWQQWLSLIPARKSLILFDTCESGTLLTDDVRTLERGAANDRMAQATGRSIITASSGSAEAVEGYRNHGLFTYNVLDAMDRGDGDSDGTIDLSELATYVYAQVTSISERVFRHRQEPQIKVSLNFPLTGQGQVLKDSPAVAQAAPTLQLAQSTQLQIKPGTGAKVMRTLSAGTSVAVIRSEGAWSLVARDGKVLGYAPSRDLLAAK